jgi:CheY-like chemotaxis protein
MRSENSTVEQKFDVLCIDDNEDFLQVLSHLIEAMGCGLSTASTAEQGLEIARSTHPDIVFCDLGLPGMDGFEFAYELRNDETLKDTPIIAISARTDEASKRKALLCGFNKIFSKPVKFADVRATLLSTLGGQLVNDRN